MLHGTYKIGPPERPNIQHDNGFLDNFPPHPPTLHDYEQYMWWRYVMLEGAESVQHIPFLPHNDLPDAIAAYRHFLTGNGADRTFSYERYVRDDPSGRITLNNAILEAEEAAEKLYHDHFRPGDPKSPPHVHFQMTGSGLSAGGRQNTWFPYPQTENWQKTIGAHWLWLSGEVDVDIQAGIPHYKVVMTLHAEDRYNFNPGMHDIATGIPDSANGEFELSGLGHQYMHYSTLVRNLTWTGAVPASDSATSGAPTSRQRQPSDNRRARNRL